MTSRKKRSFAMGIVAGLVLAVGGCWSSQNLEWPGIKARGVVTFICCSSEFEEVSFSMRECTAEFTVCMPDGRILSLADLTRETLVPLSTDSKSYLYGFMAYISCKGGSITVHWDKEENLEYIALSKYISSDEATANEDCKVGIGNRDCSEIFLLPVTRKQLIRLFGKPHRVDFKALPLFLPP